MVDSQTEGLLDDTAEAPRYLNRELSWLDFNERVLALAADDAVPLLERAKFLAIFSQNLDEFFQVRVAGLKEQVTAGIGVTSPDGRTPGQQLIEVRERVEVLVDRQQRLFLDDIVPALAANGVRLSRWDDLDEDDEKFLVETFEQRIFPVLTPLAVDPGHPFPYISNLSLNLAVLLRDPVTGERRFARVKVPDLLPRFVVMPDGERFVPLEQVIAAHLDKLFPGMEVESTATFRVSRNADLTLEEEEAEDLLAAVEVELRRRQFGRAVRLEISHDITDEVRELLLRELDLGEDDTYCHEGPLDLGGLWSVHALDRPELKDPVFQRVSPARLDNGEKERPDFFDVAPRRRRAGAPPLRLVPHHGRGVHPPGVGRPTRARHQDDALPHVGRQPHRALADPCRGARQAGGGVGRAQGALRRGRQHRVGQGAGDGGGPRGLRARRPQGAHQDLPRGARRTRWHPPLLPHRVGQLQLEDRPHLRGRRAPHVRSRHRPRPHPALQLPHRLWPRPALRDAARVAAHHPVWDRDADPQRGRGGSVGWTCIDHPEDEQPRRRADDRRALRSVRRRGADRPHHPGHLLPDPGGSWAVGQHPRALDRGSLPRAQPHLPVRQRSRARAAHRAHRLRRPDATQPRSSGRGTRAGGRARAAGPPRGDPRGQPQTTTPSPGPSTSTVPGTTSTASGPSTPTCACRTSPARGRAASADLHYSPAPGVASLAASAGASRRPAKPARLRPGFES